MKKERNGKENITILISNTNKPTEQIECFTFLISGSSVLISFGISTKNTIGKTIIITCCNRWNGCIVVKTLRANTVHNYHWQYDKQLLHPKQLHGHNQGNYAFQTSQTSIKLKQPQHFHLIPKHQICQISMVTINYFFPLPKQSMLTSPSPPREKNSKHIKIQKILEYRIADGFYRYAILHSCLTWRTVVVPQRNVEQMLNKCWTKNLKQICKSPFIEKFLH